MARQYNARRLGARRAGGAAAATARRPTTTDAGRGLHRAHRDPRGDGALVPRVLHVGHRVAGAARRARRSQAGAPPDPLLHVRPRPAARPAARQVRQGGRRRHGDLPPPRRLGHLRRPGPHGAGLLPAPPPHRRPRQLRRAQPRRRPGGHALHRVPAGPAGPRAHGRHRRGHRRLGAQLRRLGRRADRPAGPLPEPARQRVPGHRRRHGHQHPAPQHGRGHRRRHPRPRTTPRPPPTT